MSTIDEKQEMSAAGETKVCPTCEGEKIIRGVCTCDMEWRGTETGDGWEDCKCTQDETCPTCNGKGVIVE